MLSDVRQRTIEPVITGAVAAGSLVHTDEYAIYTRLPAWGYRHKAVCHGRGEYARDEDGDGFCEVHVNTIEGFWSLLRSWLRPHRGISQDKLPPISASSSSCTTRADAAKPCSEPSSPPWSHAPTSPPRNPIRASGEWPLAILRPHEGSWNSTV